MVRNSGSTLGKRKRILQLPRTASGRLVALRQTVPCSAVASNCLREARGPEADRAAVLERPRPLPGQLREQVAETTLMAYENHRAGHVGLEIRERSLVDEAIDTRPQLSGR